MQMKVQRYRVTNKNVIGDRLTEKLTNPKIIVFSLFLIQFSLTLESRIIKGPGP